MSKCALPWGPPTLFKPCIWAFVFPAWRYFCWCYFELFSKEAAGASAPVFHLYFYEVALVSVTGARDVTLCTLNAPACKPLATARHLSCKSVPLCVYVYVRRSCKATVWQCSFSRLPHGRSRLHKPAGQCRDRKDEGRRSGRWRGCEDDWSAPSRGQNKIYVTSDI